MSSDDNVEKIFNYWFIIIFCGAKFTKNISHHQLHHALINDINIYLYIAKYLLNIYLNIYLYIMH